MDLRLSRPRCSDRRGAIACALFADGEVRWSSGVLRIPTRTDLGEVTINNQRQVGPSTSWEPPNGGCGGIREIWSCCIPTSPHLLVVVGSLLATGCPADRQLAVMASARPLSFLNGTLCR